MQIDIFLMLQIICSAVFVYMSLWFLLSLILKRNDIADIAWGLGFIFVALLSFFLIGANVDRGLFVTLLVIIWGSRLSYHIYERNKKKTEDPRYLAWRNAWGKWFVLRSYLQVFFLQGFLLILISMPVIFINTYRGGEIWFLDIVGFWVWICGFYFESKGDSELKTFLSDPNNKGKILNTGLWKYTRHPNYFGEVVQWWGIWLIALAVPNGVWAIVGPLTITILILKVSGIPMLEKRMSENPLFDEYRRKTSVFIPMPPKK